MSVAHLKTLIKDVPDFPKQGVLFKDITPVLENAEAFQILVDEISRHVPAGVQKLVGIESRGFILAAAVAQKRNIGLVLARKPGKLPRDCFRESYELEYGEDELQIHRDSILPGERVCIVDDVLATGGTAAAVEKLCLQAGAQLESLVFFMEIGFLNGRQKLHHPIHALDLV